jgi:sulfite dehydrogenase (cytochrome) subunit B
MNMDSKTVIAIAFSSLVLGLGVGAPAGAKTITLPIEGPPLKASPMPGYAKAQANCVACHSAEYMLYQPPTAPRTYWEAMVTRMKVVFKAPIDDADMPVIVDYLVKTYGNEQPK